jgi:DNA-directed RNA polymerase beta' subunit
MIMTNRDDENAEELNNLKQIRRLFRKRRFILEQQLATEGLHSRPQLSMEIDSINERLEAIEQEIVKLTTPSLLASSNSNPKLESNLPEELQLDIMLRRSLLSEQQLDILRFIERHIINHKKHRIKQEIIEKNFTQFTRSEIYYRLEHLRFLGFLLKEKVGQDKNNVFHFAYSLTIQYTERLQDHLFHHDVKPGNIFLERTDDVSQDIKLDLRDLLPNTERSESEH